jgi:hypothetical protein
MTFAAHCRQETIMKINRLSTLTLVTFVGGISTQAYAQVADIAGVLVGDRWVYEITDEITGDIKETTTIVVLDVSEKEINTSVCRYLWCPDKPRRPTSARDVGAESRAAKSYPAIFSAS